MHLMTLLAGPILAWHFIRNLRRLPNDSAIPGRNCAFFDAEGSLYDITVTDEVEASEGDIIYACISAIEK